MKKVFFIITIFFFFQSSSSFCDISAKTESSPGRLKLHSGLQGTFGEAFIDSVQLGLALSSAITGESLLIDAALSGVYGGALTVPLNRVYGGWTAMQEIAQLLNSAGDKTTQAHGAVYFSKDDEYDKAYISFSALSDGTYSDPFGNIEVSVKTHPAIKVDISPKNHTSNAIGSSGNLIQVYHYGKRPYIKVTFKPKELPEGIYPTIFYAKETNCSICLSIFHNVYVYVYDPCPDLGSVCKKDISNYRDSVKAHNKEYNKEVVIISRGRQFLRRIKARSNACFHAHGRTATGGGSNEAARRRAEEEYTRCLNELTDLEEELEGECPELAYGATKAECDRLRNRDKILAPYKRKSRQAVETILSHNCCHEYVNPDGGSGPGSVTTDPNIDPGRPNFDGNPGNRSRSNSTHRANSTNTESNYTLIDNSITGNVENDSVLIATPNWNPGGSGGVYHNNNIGIYFNASKEKWAVFNQNRAKIPAGSSFNIAKLKGFTHTATRINTSGNSTYIDNTSVNNNPNAILLVTPNWTSRNNTYNDHSIGVWYDSRKRQWAIYNQDQKNMPTNTIFNVAVAKGFTHRAAKTNTEGNSTFIDNSLINDNPNAAILVTPNYNPGGSGGTYNNHATGVWYQSSKKRWAIFNQDQAAMPDGAAFNVLILNSPSRPNISVDTSRFD